MFTVFSWERRGEKERESEFKRERERERAKEKGIAKESEREKPILFLYRFIINFSYVSKINRRLKFCKQNTVF